ncbi:MAG: hypothetical protein IKK22_07295 [Firmicutes bacterium]|nr:hypothetical protein [Bacillota bacterium]
MDWSKAKNILIAALLITNLMLGTAIYRNINGSGRNEQETIKQNTILLLQDHGIFVDEEQVPEKTERLPVLSVRYRTLSEESIALAIGDSRIDLSPSASEEDYCQAAEQLLRGMGLFQDYFRCEGRQEEDGAYVISYGMEFEDHYLDNSKLKVVFREGKPVDISSSWAEPVEMGQNKKKVRSASEALIRFMTMLETGSQEAPIQVEQISLVYWLEGYTENGGVSEDTAVPYWCIQYNGGDSLHIAAYEE